MSIGLAPGFAPLLRARDYAEISQLAERELKPPVTPEAARLANLALARIAYERGDFAESAVRFEAAAQAAPDDPWLDAEAIECRYREAYLDSATRGRIAEDLDARLERDASPALLWARARIRSGIHPDERPTPAELHGADADLEDAEGQEASAEVLLARVRIKRILSRADASDRVALLDQARRYVQDVWRRLPPEDDPNRLRVTAPDVALQYEDGRLRLAEEHWDEAKARFEAVLRHDPGHQPANVWSIYAKRMTSAAEAELVAEIDHVLADPTLHTGRWSVAPAVLPDARRGVVVAREMEAELLTERAAILETGDEEALARAVADYEAALARRPRMPFAHRGLFRCLVRQGDYGRAATARERAKDALGDAIGADVLVDFGRLAFVRRDFDETIEYCDEAAGLRNDYAPAYALKLATVRASRDQALLRDAVAEAQAVIVEHGSGLRLASHLQVELGRALVELQRCDEAVAAFEAALRDETATARTIDEAAAGRIDAYRAARDFPKAVEAFPSRGAAAGPRVRAAQGWVYGELSDFERALECFEDGLRRRTRYVPLILGKARTLRLLGQPSAARRFLLERHAELPEHDQRLLGIDLGWTAIELRDWNEACRRLDDLSDPSVLRGRVAAACGAKKPVPELEEIAHQGGEHASVCFELGRCYVARRNLNAGRREFDTARALARGPEELLLLLVSEAGALIDAGALTEASATVGDAIALEEGRFDKDPTVLAVRGRLLHAAGDGAAAQRVFQAALRAWPRSQTAKVGLALAEFESGHQASARRLLAELVEACPENLAAKQVFAWMLVASHESDQELSASGWLGRAASLCNQILAKEPAMCEPYRCLSMISALEGRGRAAQLYLDQAASLDPDGAHLDPDRGAVHLQLRQYDKARAALERAMQAERTDGRVPFLLGALTLEQGDAAGAVPNFREAAAFEPRNAGFHCALATALEQAREHDDALTSLTNGLALVTERTRIPLHLARVRILHSMARAADKPEEEALLTAAMRDVERSKTLARTNADKADVAYHRGVILHAQGAVDGARKAFRSAIRQANGDHPEARHALAMLGEERRGDPNERLARRAAYALAGVAFVLLLAAIALGFVEAQGQDIFDPAWLPVVGVLLGLIGLAGVLPRLAGVKFKGFELTVAQPVAGPMPARVELGFRPVPLLMLSGLTPHRQPQPAPDLEGEPGG